MKTLSQLMEEIERHHVTAFTRMNPPTTGHMQLIDKVHSVADDHKAEHSVVVSHSQDPKKNPLTSAQKIKHLARFSSKTNVIASSKKHPTILHHLAALHKKGVTHLHLVAGSDRHAEMHKLINSYNGKKSDHGYYNFKSITIHSAGKRDPDSEGTTGISATKQRAHAAAGNFKEFRKGVPSHVSDEHARELMKDVHKNMSESIILEDEARIPKKPGQPDKSDKHSDLYTDEDPKGTIHGLKFATPEDAKTSVSKIKSSGRSHAHKIQAAIAMEQRAKVMGKEGSAAVYRSFINSMKDKTEKNEEIEMKSFNDQFEEFICINENAVSDEELLNIVNGMQDHEMDPNENDIEFLDVLIDEQFKEEESLDEELIDESRVLSLLQRQRAKIRFKARRSNLTRMRKIKRKRMATPQRLQYRARTSALMLLRNRVAGAKGRAYHTLSPAQRLTIDKTVKQRYGKNLDKLVGSISKRTLPLIRRKEMARLAKARGQKTSSVFGKQMIAMSNIDEASDYESTSKDHLLTPKVNMLLRLGLVDQDQIEQYRRALKAGEKSLGSPEMRSKILSMLDRILKLATDDPQAFSRIRAMVIKQKKGETNESKNISVNSDSISIDPLSIDPLSIDSLKVDKMDLTPDSNHLNLRKKMIRQHEAVNPDAARLRQQKRAIRIRHAKEKEALRNKHAQETGRSTGTQNQKRSFKSWTMSGVRGSGMLSIPRTGADLDRTVVRGIGSGVRKGYQAVKSLFQKNEYDPLQADKIAESLYNKSVKHNISMDEILEVYNKNMNESGNEESAFNAVNSFLANLDEVQRDADFKVIPVRKPDGTIAYRKKHKEITSKVKSIDELSTDLLARYKKKAGEQASAADRKGDFATGNKRFSGIIKATKKQFDNDLKKEEVTNLTFKNRSAKIIGDKLRQIAARKAATDAALARHKSEQEPEKKKVVEEFEICETAAAGLAAKAEKSGISIGTLRKVYNRGMAAWNSGHRPGTTPQQWAMARVNSYIGKGSGTYHGADKDLREEDILDEAVPKHKGTGLPQKYVAGLSAATAEKRAAHFAKADKLSDRDPAAYKPAPGDATAKTKLSKHTIKYRAMFGEDMDEEIYEACWDTHKQVGMKRKGDRMVPDCVPKNEQSEEEGTDALRKKYEKNTPGQQVETLNMKKANMGDVIKDFQSSDAPQFKGKSLKKIRQMAIAAKLSSQDKE